MLTKSTPSEASHRIQISADQAVAGDIAREISTGDSSSLPLVSLSKVRVSTAGKKSNTLLSLDSLALYPGERIVLTGPSGSGKSLLLSLLSGTTSPALTVEGVATRTYRRCGVIPQRGIEALHPLQKISKQLGKVTGASTEEIAQTLASVGLDANEVGRRRPSELSGGQAQRVAIALAVLSKAELILADEPTSALDHESRDQTLDLLLSVITDQQSLVITTHDPQVAERVNGRRVYVEAGSVGFSPKVAQ